MKHIAWFLCGLLVANAQGTTDCPDCEAQIQQLSVPTLVSGQNSDAAVQQELRLISAASPALPPLNSQLTSRLQASGSRPLRYTVAYNFDPFANAAQPQAQPVRNWGNEVDRNAYIQQNQQQAAQDIPLAVEVDEFKGCANGAVGGAAQTLGPVYVQPPAQVTAQPQNQVPINQVITYQSNNDDSGSLNLNPNQGGTATAQGGSASAGPGQTVISPGGQAFASQGVQVNANQGDQYYQNPSDASYGNVQDFSDLAPSQNDSY